MSENQNTIAVALKQSKKEIICAKSGLVFTCQFMPVSLKKSEVCHPFFHIAKRSLLSLTGKWANSELGTEEIYLYYLSLLDSSGLIVWRHPAKFSSETLAMMQASMENLLRTVERMEKTNFQHLKHLPHFTITKDTASLLNVPYFLDSWNDAITESIKGYKTVTEIYEEQVKETAIERLIRSPYRSNDKALAAKLADWADQAGNFPDFNTLLPNGKYAPVSTLWKEIIVACVDDDRIYNIPRKDLEELIEHVIDNIPQGTIHAAKLLEFLRTALNKKVDYTSLGFGSENLAGKTTTFTIIRNDTDREKATIQTMIAEAPASEPQRKDFATLAEYLRAKSRWNVSKTAAPVIMRQAIDEEDLEPSKYDPDFYPTEDDME